MVHDLLDIEVEQYLVGTQKGKYRVYWKLYRGGRGPGGNSVKMVEDILRTIMKTVQDRPGPYRGGPAGTSMKMVQDLRGNSTGIGQICWERDGD
eukprot:2698994-Pyramimonas_sp.AAC.1